MSTRMRREMHCTSSDIPQTPATGGIAPNGCTGCRCTGADGSSGHAVLRQVLPANPPAPPARSAQTLLQLFPRRWQRHYGDEFLALLAEQPPDWRDLADIVRSAAHARLRPAAWLPPQAIADTDTQPLRAQEVEPERTPVVAEPGAVITVGGRGGNGHGSGRGRGHGRGSGTGNRDDQRRFNRRQFLRNSLLGGVAVAAAAGGAAVLVYTMPDDEEANPIFGSSVRVAAVDIPAIGAPSYVHEAGRFHLIQNEDGLLALYWRCTHLHCTVPFVADEDEFQCPCHGSHYDRHGVVLAGPAPRPLDLMRLRRDDSSGDVIVDTGVITERDAFEPSQALPL